MLRAALLCRGDVGQLLAQVDEDEGVDDDGAELDDEDPQVMQPEALRLVLVRRPALKRGKLVFHSRILFGMPAVMEEES